MTTRTADPSETSLPDSLPAGFQKWTGTLLARAAYRLRSRFEDRIAPLKIRARHYAVLVLLQSGPLTQVEIGRLLGVDRTTMVGLIDHLERVGYVVREHPPQDRRAYAVRLTEAGQNALTVGTEAADACDEECFRALSPSDRATLRELLSRL